MEDYRLKQLIEEQLRYDKAKSRRADVQDDQEIAEELQRQFNQEVATENPLNLVYERNKNTIDSTKSLVDPSWELIDPTPNIYNLFIAFNQQYFWNKLLAVCVSWSKRMTTCAGICSYQPRAGLCSITLSEPLLKLRPRKDLVETLLHEMIHAFLFVTHNNRDREGHGPEFHKHMYRINSEAGTNITVYHSFHDEVRLYQQHWWKCNGPCQHQQPYFGMIRRASNRAPGPNDRWWAEHSRNCGGIFIKVKEPEKAVKKMGKENAKPTDGNKLIGVKSKSKTPAKGADTPKNGDIRSFFPIANKSNTCPVVNNPAKSVSGGILQRKMHDNAKISNINGFKPGESGSLDVRNSNASNSVKPIALFNGSGRSLASSSSNTTRNSPGKHDYSTVRNHWLGKFAQPAEPALKRPKLNLVECPVCSKSVPQADLNIHLDTCLNAPSSPTSPICIEPSSTIKSISSSNSINSLVECDICEDWVNSADIEQHKQICLQNMSTQLDSSISKECPICQEPLCSSIYDSHVASCLMKNINSVLQQAGSFLDAEESVKCLVCKKTVSKRCLNKHLDECMTEEIFMDDAEHHSYFDDSFDPHQTNNTDKDVNSIADGQEVEEVLVSDDISKVTDDSFQYHQGQTVNDLLDCPVCQKKIEQRLINEHLDNCLG